MNKIEKKIYLDILASNSDTYDIYSRTLTKWLKSPISVKKIEYKFYGSYLKTHLDVNQFFKKLKKYFDIEIYSFNYNKIRHNDKNYFLYEDKNTIIKLKFNNEIALIAIDYYYDDDAKILDCTKIEEVKVYINSEFKTLEKFYKKFNKVVEFFVENMNNNKIEIKDHNIHIILQNNQGLYLKKFDMENYDSTIPFELLYNNNINNFYIQLINKLKSNNKGIYILHGKPGTGKTTFIRKLITEEALKNKKIVYCTNEILSSITSTTLLNFLSSNKNTEFIFICEDCEEFLRKRSKGNYMAPAILNFSDGILNSLVNIQFIFTHNTPNQEDIDDGFFRDGRLMANQEFKDLSYEEWSKLIEWVEPEFKPTDNKNKTLAEIFEMINIFKNSSESILKNKKDKIVIGFNN